ncbi:uncharacterized protein LOC131957588 [Physella acuta]|uniref:uncharacterized protein LOC131957588 n=1 Tax=Physella acuta TaxID=109671 RepID=UPI0027DBF410|nr:uncharacterized protein LOC131957588 [Physella acuta]
MATTLNAKECSQRPHTLLLSPKVFSVPSLRVEGPADVSRSRDLPATDQTDSIPLPFRYQVRLCESRDGLGCDVTSSEEDTWSREEDLTTALKWIRQEILQMKEQDKSLLKQFKDLRASILQLRCIYTMHSSCSDVSSLEGSTYSLNEPAKSPRLRRLMQDTRSNKLSVSLPSSPLVERFKWTTDHYI